MFTYRIAFRFLLLCVLVATSSSCLIHEYKQRGPYSLVGYTEYESDDFNGYNKAVISFKLAMSDDHEKARDLALLRASERALELGFKYFAINDEEVLAEGAYELQPEVTLWVVMFKNKNEFFDQLYDARETFLRITGKYHIERELIQGDYHVPEIELVPTRYAGFFSESDIKNFYVNASGLIDYPAGLYVARYMSYENPYGSFDEYLKEVVPKAKKLGANYVLLYDDSKLIKLWGYKNAGFLSVFFFAYEASLGIDWNRTGKGGSYFTVRGFKEGSYAQSSGVKVNDQLVKINGYDYFKEPDKYLQEYKNAKPGDIFNATFIRGDELVEFKIKLMGNLTKANVYSQSPA